MAWPNSAYGVDTYDPDLSPAYKRMRPFVSYAFHLMAGHRCSEIIHNSRILNGLAEGVCVQCKSELLNNLLSLRRPENQQNDYKRNERWIHA